MEKYNKTMLYKVVNVVKYVSTCIIAKRLLHSKQYFIDSFNNTVDNFRIS